MGRPQTLYDVPCPWCGAREDEKCVTTTTRKPLPTFHVQRRLAFRIRRPG